MAQTRLPVPGELRKPKCMGHRTRKIKLGMETLAGRWILLIEAQICG